MTFNSNEMLELKHIATDRYQRAGGGGAFGMIRQTCQDQFIACALAMLGAFLIAAFLL